MDPSLQDNDVLIPDNFFEYIDHTGCYFNKHSIISSGLIAGSKNAGRDRQKVFQTAVDLVNTHCLEQKEFDLTKPRLAAHKQNWKVHQDAVYWVDIGRAQRMGLKFFQSRSKAIVTKAPWTSESEDYHIQQCKKLNMHAFVS